MDTGTNLCQQPPTNRQSLPRESTFRNAEAFFLLPPAIWQAPFNPQSSQLPTFAPVEIEDHVYTTCGGQPGEQLEVRGRNVGELADDFAGLLDVAIEDSDFTHVLSGRRHFVM